MSYFSGTVSLLISSECVGRCNDQVAGVGAHRWAYEARFLSGASGALLRGVALSGERLSTVVGEDAAAEGAAGESVRIGHPHCRHPLMTLNAARTRCHFSQRLDVGVHHVRTGGFNRHLEYLDKMVARILPFRRRLVHHKPNAYDSHVHFKRLKGECSRFLKANPHVLI